MDLLLLLVSTGIVNMFYLYNSMLKDIGQLKNNLSSLPYILPNVLITCETASSSAEAGP